MCMSRRKALLLLLFLLLLSNARSNAQTGERQLVDSLVRAADSLNALIDGPSAIPDTGHKAAAGIPAPTDGAAYTISGVIRDKGTLEGIPFAAVIIPGSTEGAPADIDGKFSFSFSGHPGDTLRVSAIGYTTRNIRLRLGDDHQPKLEIELTRESTQLTEFVFHAGEDPAITLLKQIIAHKPQNNPDRLPAYSYNVYNKLEVDVQHLSRKQFESLPVPMIKKFGFVFNNMDSTSEKTPFLPFFLTETLSDYYFQRNPKKVREFIRATQVKGVKNESIDQFLGSYYQNVNAYGNFIPVFDKQFVSPISSNGAFYYKYRIKDTQTAYGHPVILVQFRPKRDGENCFYGDFWVVDSVYAIQRISMEVPKTANINYVSRVSLYQETAPVRGDSLWFTVKDKFTSDFHLPYSPKLPGFIGRKTTIYRNVGLGEDTISRIVNDARFKKDVIVADTAREQGEAFWQSARPDSLSKNEKAIYSMIDTLNALPVFQRFKRTMQFLFGGFVSIGPVDVGPYYNIYSRNRVEGNRFRLGLATNQKLFKDIRLSGYAAYGTRDEAFKYYGDIYWILNRDPRSYIFASYRHDLDRSNAYYDNQVGADNIFAGIARKRGVPYKLAFTDDARFEYFRSYYSGFSHDLTLQHRRFEPLLPLPRAGIFTDEHGVEHDAVISSEVGLRLRYAWKEQFLESHYFRQSLGSKYPIVELRASAGLKDVMNSGYQYQKATISISDNMKIAPLGKIYYNLFAGRTFSAGALPYPLLDVAPGNEFYYYNRNAFNMMNRYEFISDQYAGFNFEHQIGGGIFNYIPLLKRAKLRQFWTAKGIIGSLSDENRKLNFDKGYTFRTLEGNPYVEVGTGVENILQLFRLDFIWRVTPKPLPDEERVHYFGIFGSVRFNF